LDLLKNLYSEIRVEGLETLDYLDNLSQKARVTEQGDAITFESEVNLVGSIYDYIIYIFNVPRCKLSFYFWLW
jgi:hypothetical protein